MKLIFNEWPDEAEDREVCFTKIAGDGVITQVTLEFSREDAENKAKALNDNMPGLATVLGPFRLKTQE